MISAALATDLTLMLLATSIKRPFRGVVEDIQALGIFQLDRRKLGHFPARQAGVLDV